MVFWESFSGVAVQAQAKRTNGVYPLWGKRIFDLGVCLTLLPVVVPLITLICAIAAAFGSAGLYPHTRVGRNGRTFSCWKIRTMVLGADSALAQICAADHARHAEWTRFRKLSDDPRILPFGRFLRLTSLDELPQIWNVLRGDMSLVGPRPVTVEELPLYGDILPEYLRLRPGITGLWQVTARRTGSFEQRVALDLQYANSLCLRKDLKILVKTLPVLLRPTGR